MTAFNLLSLHTQIQATKSYEMLLEDKVQTRKTNLKILAILDKIVTLTIGDYDKSTKCFLYIVST